MVANPGFGISGAAGPTQMSIVGAAPPTWTDCSIPMLPCGTRAQYQESTFPARKWGFPTKSLSNHTMGFGDDSFGSWCEVEALVIVSYKRWGFGGILELF